MAASCEVRGDGWRGRWAVLGVADGSGLAKGERSAVTSEGDGLCFCVSFSAVR